METVLHTLQPVYNKQSKVLILGTIPSPKSREYGFYYSHPQNRFWRVISAILNEPIPVTNAEKEQLVLTHRIALWDVLASCEIKGADDNSIKNPVVNNIASLLADTNIKTIFTTGTKATTLYQRYCYPQTRVPTIKLSSTSPANCRNCNLETLTEEYKIILEHLK